MSDPFSIPHPIQRDGTSQAQRLVGALKPTSVGLDERDVADWLRYAYDYAQLLRFYDLDNTPNGDWQAFLEHDVSMRIALLANVDYEADRTAHQDRLDAVGDAADPGEKGAAFAALLPPVVAIATQVDMWYRGADPVLALYTALDRLINSTLSDALRALVATSLRAQDVGFPVDAVDTTAFSAAWQLTGVQADTTLFASGTPDDPAEIEAAAERVKDLFEPFYEALVYLVDRAEDFLTETLEDYDAHQPHVALFLAFLLLLRHARDHVNELTEQHLLFYYQDVLGLTEAPAQPDSVHLVFTLAKNFTEHRVDAGTALKAGKDAGSPPKERRYTTDNELIVNQTVVDDTDGLKTLFLDVGPARTHYNLFVAYDLVGPGRDYEAMYDAIEALSEQAIRVLRSFWYVQTSQTAAAVRDALTAVLDADDRLFVVDASRRTVAAQRVADASSIEEELQAAGHHLFISYDLFAPIQRYEALFATLSGLGLDSTALRVMESFWYVRSATPAATVRDALAAYLDDVGTDDALLVVAAGADAVAEHGLPSEVASHVNTQMAAARTMATETVATNVVHGLYAAPDADSADGEGADLKADDGKWETFGSAAMPEARVGFAVASPMLWLQESTRTVIIYLEVDAIPDDIAGARLQVEAELKHNVSVYASGAKGWIPVSIESVMVQVDAVTTYGVTGPWVGFMLRLEADAPAVVAYDEKVHADGLNTTHPVFKFVLDPDGYSAAGGFDLHLAEDVDDYDATTTYDEGDYVAIDHEVYRALTDEPAAEPDINETAWFFVGRVSAYSSSATYSLGDYVRYEDALYEALTDDLQGVTPGTSTAVWRPVPRSHPYRYFEPLAVRRLHVNVDVMTVQSLVLESDLGVLNPAKPFQPFGPTPRVGSSFYVGSTEIFQKPVDNLILNITWADLPTENFSDYYAEYGSDAPDDNEYFKVDVEVLEDGAWRSLKTDIRLFNDGADSDPSDDLDPPPDAARALGMTLVPLLARDADLASFDRFSRRLQQGFLRLTLKTDFLHRQYPKRLAEEAGKEAPSIPNAPYTPLIASLSVRYSARQMVDYASFGAGDVDDRIEQFFHLYPFGHAEVVPVSDDIEVDDVLVRRTPVPTLGVTVEAEDGTVTTERAVGTLYVGLDNLDPPENVAILFQVAEGSADPEADTQPVVWSYLADNTWIDFDSIEIVADTTNGLLTSGIITFAMPKTMTDDDTVLPSGLHWIKASVAAHPEAVSQLIAVKPQAVEATFQDRGNDLSHLATALPADIISKLEQRRAAIKAVAQPFASFGGRPRETGEAFYTRVSERLRHKQRAVTLYDYERLVLEAFPVVYKVKCIPHTGEAGEHVPGAVTVIAVPNLRNQNAVDPLQPRVSKNTLETIDDFLATHASGFIDLYVKNPQYEQVQADFKVTFQPGKDVGFYLKQLEEDVIRFLSPWLYEEGADLAFGGKIHRSWILDYIEERDYVDIVTDFTLNHIVGEETNTDVEEAVATTARSVLVSATEHRIAERKRLDACAA